MSRRRRFSRRTFVKGALTAGALTPVMLSPLWARRAKAAPPRRVMFVYLPDGCIPDRWHPQGSERSFTLPAMSEPLNAVKDKMTFIDGLDMYAGGPTHEGGIAKVLTGTGPVSLDVYLGQQIGRETLHQSIHLGVAANFQNGSGSFSYIGAGQEVKPDDNPLNAFDRIFGGGVPEGDDGAEEAERQRRRRAAILETSLTDLNGLRSRVSGREKDKLDTHLESLEEVQRRVAATGMMEPGGGTSCDISTWNTEGYVNIETDYYPKTYDKEENFLTVGKLQMDLAVLAFSCDVTRVASLMWSHPVSPTHVPGTGVTVNNHDSSHYGNPDSPNAQSYTTLKRWFCDRMVYLIQKLQNTPDSQGGSLLDSTLIMMCSELGDGNNHDHRRMPFAVAGGGVGDGRFLDYRGTAGGENDSHAKLLVSIARWAGVDINEFGYTGHGAGPLPGLL